MNRVKVERLRPTELLAKLGEEFGEVCQRYVQVLESEDIKDACDRRDQMIEELEHVMLVAEVWHDKSVALNKAERLKYGGA